MASQVSLFPNPSSGNSALNLSLQQSTSVRLQVLDVKGAVLQQRTVLLPAGNSTLPVNLSSYPDGVYSIRVQYGTETKTLKLIKK